MNTPAAATSTPDPVIRYRISIRTQADVARAVTQARGACAAIGFDDSRCAQVGTAVSELATNIVKYAQHGSVDMREISRAGKVGIEVTVADQGPGMADVDSAQVEHFTTGGSLGLGLSGARRLMDEMHIESTPGVGTRIVARKWG